VFFPPLLQYVLGGYDHQKQGVVNLNGQTLYEADRLYSRTDCFESYIDHTVAIALPVCSTLAKCWLCVIAKGDRQPQAIHCTGIAGSEHSKERADAKWRLKSAPSNSSKTRRAQAEP
jgi:hypothetical protein